MKNLIIKTIYAISAKIAFQAPWCIVKESDYVQRKIITKDKKEHLVWVPKDGLIISKEGVETKWDPDKAKFYIPMKDKFLVFGTAIPYGKEYDKKTTKVKTKYLVMTDYRLFSKDYEEKGEVNAKYKSPTGEFNYEGEIERTIDLFESEVWAYSLVNYFDDFARQFLISAKPEIRKDNANLRPLSISEKETRDKGVTKEAWETQFTEDKLSAIYNKSVFNNALENTTLAGLEISYYDYFNRHNINDIFSPSTYFSRFGSDIILLVSGLSNLTKVNNLGSLTYGIPFEYGYILDHPDSFWDVPVDRNYRTEGKINTREKALNLFESKLSMHYLNKEYVEKRDFRNYKEDIAASFKALSKADESNAIFIRGLNNSSYFMYIDNEHNKTIDGNYFDRLRTENTYESIESFYKQHNRNSIISGVYGNDYEISHFILSKRRIQFVVDKTYEHTYNCVSKGELTYFNETVVDFDAFMPVIKRFQIDTFTKNYKNGDSAKVYPGNIKKDDLLNKDVKISIEGNINVSSTEMIRMVEEGVKIRKIVVMLDQYLKPSDPDYYYDKNTKEIRNYFAVDHSNLVEVPIKIDASIDPVRLDLNLSDIEPLSFSFININKLLKYVEFVDKSGKTYELTAETLDADTQALKDMVTKNGGLIDKYGITHEDLLRYVNALISIQIQMILFTNTDISFKEDGAMKDRIKSKVKLKSN